MKFQPNKFAKKSPQGVFTNSGKIFPEILEKHSQKFWK